MIFKRLVFRIHAIQRMFQCHISEDDVRRVLTTGEIIENYPGDIPYPSELILGWSGSRPIHVVIANNVDARESIVVTVYEPNLGQWEPGFRRRKS